MAHPALAAGRVAVITGAAGGIGLAMAKQCAKLGMKVFLADNAEADLAKAGAACVEAGGDASKVATKVVDVGNYESVSSLKAEVFEKFGEVGFLFSNAGVIGGGAGPYTNMEMWQRVLQVNLWGVINTTQAFTQAMVDQGTDCLIVNTGSKQGITCPPGGTGYNVSKAGVKVLTEGLAHELRNKEGCKVTVALLVPGWTNTELIRRLKEREAGGPVPLENVFFCEEKPQPGAWMPNQVVDYFMEKIAAGKFYIICPDNEVTEEIDRKRMLWSATDIPEGRPPLSRWHPDYKEAFEAFMARKKVLIVSTSASKMGDHDTGAWSEEICGPYYTFLDAGCDVTVCSIAGGDIPIDAGSVSENFLTENDKKMIEAGSGPLKGTKALSTMDATAYDIVFFAGGHGTCVDFPTDEVGAVVSKVLAAGKVVGAVCHGPMCLVSAKTAEGDPVVKGKSIACFTDAEEEMVGLTAKVPFLLQAKLTELGAKVELADPWNVKSVKDGKLVTGQNPQSSVSCAKLALEA